MEIELWRVWVLAILSIIGTITLVFLIGWGDKYDLIKIKNKGNEK